MDAKTDDSPKPFHALYTQPDITARGRFSKSHLYNLIARGQFPAPTVRCGPRFTRWSAVQCDKWFADPQGYMAAHGEGAV